MERKPYSAGAVKFSFWFMEFRKTVQLLSEGKSFADIKKLNEETNIYGAPTKLRAQQIYSTVTARIKTLDESFYPIFLSSDLATQKLFVLTAALLHDTLFFDFVYEVVREKMILGSDELTDADIRIFFKNKQEQSEKVASLQDYTLRRLGSCYKTQAAMLICLFTRFPHVLLLIVIMAGKELYMVVSGCLVIRKTGKVHGADWHGKIVTFLLYGTAAVHIIWFHITPMVSDLLIGLCAIMMVISVALYIIQNTRTLKGETV